jgi:hypothetical protein
MKTPYLYFGRKGFAIQEANTNGVQDALTLPNSGMLPIQKANNVLSTNLRVLHKCGGAVGAKRGNLLLTSTDATQVDFVDGSDLTADLVVGEVTNLSGLVKSYTIGNDDQIVSILTVSDTSGLTSTTDDVIYFEETKLHAEVLPIAALQSDMCLPANAFLGAEPRAFTEGGSNSPDAGLYHDGTGLDATRLYFKSGDGSPAVDKVDLVHTAGKFKEICEAMEDLMNCGIYDKVVKVHMLTADGQFVHNAFSSRGISIKRCILTSGGRS